MPKMISESIFIVYLLNTHPAQPITELDIFPAQVPEILIKKARVDQYLSFYRKVPGGEISERNIAVSSGIALVPLCKVFKAGGVYDPALDDDAGVPLLRRD